MMLRLTGCGVVFYVLWQMTCRLGLQQLSQLCARITRRTRTPSWRKEPPSESHASACPPHISLKKISPGLVFNESFWCPAQRHSCSIIRLLANVIHAGSLLLWLLSTFDWGHMTAWSMVSCYGRWQTMMSLPSVWSCNICFKRALFSSDNDLTQATNKQWKSHVMY